MRPCLTNNKEKYKNSQLKLRYQISLEQFNQMLIAQNKRCAICENKFKSGKDTHVDHDHKTKLVRQLLCRNCNILLGNCKESVILLQRSIDYLKKWDVSNK